VTLGFTGTSSGMTQPQRTMVGHLLEELKAEALHLGDCIGADHEAYAECARLGILKIGHPPTDPHKRAFLDYDVAAPPKPYLKRNKDIVHFGVDGLIAAPKDYDEPVSKRGQGTWTTVGYARQAGRRIWIVLPDGMLRKENQS
jgi:hypothetical protein